MKPKINDYKVVVKRERELRAMTGGRGRLMGLGENWWLGWWLYEILMPANWEVTNPNSELPTAIVVFNEDALLDDDKHCGLK